MGHDQLDPVAGDQRHAVASTEATGERPPGKRRDPTIEGRPRQPGSAVNETHPVGVTLSRLG